MSTAGKFSEYGVFAADLGNAMVVEPVGAATPAGDAKSMMAVRPGMSALEYIVETAQPGEVIHVDEGDYYNQHLWRSYRELDTRYSRT